MDEFEPFLLTYADKPGSEFRVVCLTSEEADAAFHNLFTTMGETHPYSVDEVPADLIRLLAPHMNMREST
jgi:hypothetical protein